MNKIKLIALALALVIFAGCTKKYEDDEMTEVFINTHKDEVAQISYMKAYTTYNHKRLAYSEYFFDLISEEALGCSEYYIYIDSDTLEFEEYDVLRQGKEVMYKEAEKCLRYVIRDIEEKLDLEIKNSKKLAEPFKSKN